MCTVMMTPVRIRPRWKDCCVVLATFSRVLNLPHCTLPSSFTTVICFLAGPLAPPKLFCVAPLRPIFGTSNAGLRCRFECSSSTVPRRARFATILMMSLDLGQARSATIHDGLMEMEVICLREQHAMMGEAVLLSGPHSP